MSRRACVCLALLAAALSADRSWAQGVLWNEASQGDLSNNQLAPNQFTVSVGVSSFIGTVANPNDPRDFITLTFPPDLALTSMVLSSYVSADLIGFTGVQSGTSFPGSLGDPASYLGYTHFGTATLGQDHLPMMGVASGAQGFTPPLPAGSYTFVIQQTGTALTSYQWDFGVASVPEPATLLLVPAAAGVFGLWRWRSRRRGRTCS